MTNYVADTDEWSDLFNESSVLFGNPTQKVEGV
jgi:hypothetical protein